MWKPVWVLGSLVALLAACDGTGGASSTTQSGVSTLPEGVLAIVGPYQDLSAVKIDPADGCYYYRHVGPVETTYLPLRAKSGRPICTRAPGEAPAQG